MAIKHKHRHHVQWRFVSGTASQAQAWMILIILIFLTFQISIIIKQYNNNILEDYMTFLWLWGGPCTKLLFFFLQHQIIVTIYLSGVIDTLFWWTGHWYSNKLMHIVNFLTFKFIIFKFNKIKIIFLCRKLESFYSHISYAVMKKLMAKK